MRCSNPVLLCSQAVFAGKEIEKNRSHDVLFIWYLLVLEQKILFPSITYFFMYNSTALSSPLSRIPLLCLLSHAFVFFFKTDLIVPWPIPLLSSSSPPHTLFIFV